MRIRSKAMTVLAEVIVFLVLISRLSRMTGHAGAGLTPVPAVTQPPAVGSTPALVELFTSEGCSSCPPADALLMRLGRTQPVREADVIVLEEHVDYWDRLGWKGPVSSGAATATQRESGEGVGDRQVYTTPMVVDGRAEFVGALEGQALQAVRAAGAAPKPAVRL